eukprot:COSAG01_NODE_938_length_12628_cov_8.320137_7_plen_146_part_00
MHYATGLSTGRPETVNPWSGAVLQLHVDPGNCYHVRDRSDPMMRTWAEHGYDSAYAAAGVIGLREEHCIKDPQRIRVTNVILGHTAQAASVGYTIQDARLSLDERVAPQLRRQQEEANARKPGNAGGGALRRIRKASECSSTPDA